MIEQLIEAGRHIVEANMVKGWGGNLSGRSQDGIVITRSGADLGRLVPEDFVHVPWDVSVSWARENLLPRPSSELSMHMAAYATRPETQVVLHAHPPKSISVGLIGHSLPALTPDFYLHLGPAVPLLSYITPTTEELGTAVAALLHTAPAILLQNHGAIVIGRTTGQALLRLNLLEEQASIYLDALAAGKPRTLTAEDMRQLDQVTGGRYRYN
ncbi:MAG: class II aldolase/adducin family protein [Chloroflexi bacterium]|nr:MAG: class II aldolase/adducin family protein [Chloroflexota bacterium]